MLVAGWRTKCTSRVRKHIISGRKRTLPQENCLATYACGFQESCLRNFWVGTKAHIGRPMWCAFMRVLHMLHGSRRGRHFTARDGGQPSFDSESQVTKSRQCGNSGMLFAQLTARAGGRTRQTADCGAPCILPPARRNTTKAVLCSRDHCAR